MARSRRTKIAPEDKRRVVWSVPAGEMSCREAARRLGVSPDSVIQWKHQFLEAGAQPHQALADRSSKQTYLDGTNQPRNLPIS